MKQYETAQIEVVCFEALDVITTSNGNDNVGTIPSGWGE